MVRLLASRWADQLASQGKSLERPVPLAPHAIAMLGYSGSHVANEYLFKLKFINPVKSISYHRNEEKTNHDI